MNININITLHILFTKMSHLEKYVLLIYSFDIFCMHTLI